MTDNKILANDTYDAWNERDFDRATANMAPDAKITVVGTGETFTGPDGARAYSTMWADAFPDGSIKVDRIVGEGDLVAVEFTGRGTHTGTLTTAMGSIPATGRELTLKLCDVYEFRDGKIREQHAYFDTGSLMAQLGVTSPQGAAEAK
jgi:steroid delta-isomerase-like uncharacterized protein